MGVVIKISIWVFALILLVLFTIICIVLWKLLKDKSAGKISLLGIEVTVIGGIIVIKSSDNLMC